MQNEIWYLATPYTLYEYGLDAAFVKAAKIAAELLQRGENVFSPIVHSHPIAAYGQIDPRDHDFWMGVDKAMMNACTGLIVVTMPGWLKSKGVRKEIDAFNLAGKPVKYYDPETATLAGQN